MLTTTAAGRTWDFSHALGAFTTEGEGFLHPSDLAIGGDGSIYVVSRGQFATMDTQISKNRLRITKLDLDEVLLGEFATGHFSWPTGLALDFNQNLYCSDEFDNLIYVYNSEGVQLNKWGKKGTRAGEFSGPSGIEFDHHNNMLLVDTFNNRIQKYDTAGQFINQWGHGGTSEGSFDRPWGITVDQFGFIYVADWGNSRVQKFSGDGEYVMSFGSDTPGSNLDHPADVAVDSDGDVYITDWGNKRVQIYDDCGVVISSLYGDAFEFSKWGKQIVDASEDITKAYKRVNDLEPMARFDRPRGIKIDKSDRIYVVDSTRCRIQVYSKIRQYNDPQFNL